jgi:glycosyltransferase involved in cell wall biosynthesis
MIIGYDGSRAFVEGRTGTENYSYQLLKALTKIDTDNHYLVYVRPRFLRNELWPENVEFKEIKWPRLWTQGGLAKQTFKDNLDVLFIPSHTSPLIHKPGLKTVATVHDLGAEYLPKMHQLKQRLYLKWITNYQLKKATKLIAVSEATKKDLVKKVGIDQNTIKVVHEGYNTQLFTSTKDDILVNSLNKFELEKRKYFLYVGTIQPRKNLERLIKAFHSVIPLKKGIQTPVNVLDSRLRGNGNLKLVIVGSKGWLSDKIYALPKKLGIEDQVKFLGRVEDQDLPALYSGAIALTYPSLFEGFGLPILEAQACGCPVITSKISSMPEVGGKGVVLVDPYSEEEIAEAMVKVQSTESREQLVKAGFNNIKRFSWEKCAKETLKVLTSI